VHEQGKKDILKREDKRLQDDQTKIKMRRKIGRKLKVSFSTPQSTTISKRQRTAASTPSSSKSLPCNCRELAKALPVEHK